MPPAFKPRRSVASPTPIIRATTALPLPSATKNRCTRELIVAELLEVAHYVEQATVRVDAGVALVRRIQVFQSARKRSSR